MQKLRKAIREPQLVTVNCKAVQPLAVKTYFDLLEQKGRSTWEAFEESLTITAKEMVPNGKKWMTQEIVDNAN